MTNLEKFRAHTELADQLLQSSTHQQLAEALQILALNCAVVTEAAQVLAAWRG